MISLENLFSKIITTGCLLLSMSTILVGQTIHYDYDNSGNRLKRYIIPLKSGNISNEDTLQGAIGNSKKEEFEDKLGEVTIKIYPNPTHGDLLVELSGLGTEETIDYQIFSQTGLLLVVNRQIGSQFSVDFSKYTTGIYILRLMIKGKKSEWKILKE